MNTIRSATDLYYDTAGEIEARDAQNRRNLTAKERRNTNTVTDVTVHREETNKIFFETGGFSLYILYTSLLL